MNNDHSRPSVPSRRDFLQVAAGTLATAALASSASARATSWGMAPSQPAPKGRARVQAKDGEAVKIGVIGLGGPGGCAMGLGHCLDFARIHAKGEEKVHVAAICDLNKIHLEYGRSALEKEQKDLKVEAYTDYKKLLERDDLHGVLLAVPEHWHADLAIAAIAAGKDVYLEKPMTLRLADAFRLLEAQKANPDLRVQVGTQQVNMPKFHEARKLIKDGTIGVPTFSQTSYCRNSKTGEWHYTINPAWKPGENLDWDTWCGPLGPMAWDPKVYYQWRRYRKTSTGVIGDLLVHVMTPMLMALDQGWPVKVAATGAHLVDKAMENHDNVHITAQFETGHQMLVAGSTCNEVGLETLIRGHKGNIYLGGRNCVVRPERVWAEELDEKKVECPDIGDDQHRHRLKWLRCIRTREQPDSTVELGAKVMVVVDLATRSMWEGGAFGFDPETLAVTKL
jgi:predicted dehydrogenase